ncbi:hypothetical protein HNR06_001829 [Nocardiopsis arvandica]|uniref:Uncharacterized protein n=1 Tax=Nocardiopsis sinuspersici TaxID=501010 RepID=A0A7Y9XCJ4_9ACTN|nr:hypothetical protein [Nocardiopsis sinuspersici]NYH52240.1 hypothetical protein [Nocardiopsis sinuspersici]
MENLYQYFHAPDAEAGSFKIRRCADSPLQDGSDRIHKQARAS